MSLSSIPTSSDATVSLPVESRKYLKLLAEQGLLQFFVAVKVRESKQLFLKVRIAESAALATLPKATLCTSLHGQ